MKIWLKRALRTFFQAFVGYISANLMLQIGNTTADGVKTVVAGVVASALAAGVCAVMNIKEEDCR